MMKIAVSVLSLVAIVSAGGPVSYSTFTPSSSYTFSSGAVAGPAVRAYAAPSYSAAAYPQQLAYSAPAPVAYAQQPALLRSAPVAYAQPAYATHVKTLAPEPYDAHPQYNYGYSVQDGYTGDQKSHSESRDGDVVQGQYSLVEPDGAIRTVTYTADAFNGFNAVVSRQAPQVAVKQVVQAAPVAVGYKTLAQPGLRYY